MAINKNERIEHNLEINEGETPSIIVTGRDGAEAVISTGNINNIYVRVDDYHSETAITALTDLTGAANPVTYTLTEAQTKIVDSERPFEFRYVTFDFVYDTAGHITEEYVIKVKNLKFHSV